MVSEWTDSGKWDGRKSVKVGNGMGSERADSGTGREWYGSSSSCGGTGEVGKHRWGKEISQPFRFPYRSRTVLTIFPVPTFTARSPENKSIVVCTINSRIGLTLNDYTIGERLSKRFRWGHGLQRQKALT